MKKVILRSLIGLGVVCLGLSLSLNLFAGPAPAGSLLVQAYGTLERADHDYKGHRVAAMKQIEAAGALLGVSVRGDGKGHEKQGVSDEQLRIAQDLLEQARPGLSGRALRHVNNAVTQITTALSIK